MARQRATLALVATLLAQLFLIPLAAAQGTGNLIPSTLPACVKQCGVIQNAAGSCSTTPATAQSCFCQSALLTPLKSAPNNICAPSCSNDEFNQIASWYKSTCANGGTTTTGQSGQNNQNGQNGQNDNANTATPSPSPTTSSSGSNAQINQNLSPSQWWDSHWQWIVMVIVLAVAFTAIGVIGRIWYRKRHRKVDGEIVEIDQPSSAPDMAEWAPPRHSVHDIAGASSRTRAESTIAPLPRRKSSKGKRPEGERPEMIRSHSQRLKKAMRDVQM